MEPDVKTGFPCKFEDYDTDKNDKIDFEEFQAALKLSNKKFAREAFKEFDKSGDGLINCDEFKNSKHEFECEPQGCESNNNEADEEFWDTM